MSTLYTGLASCHEYQVNHKGESGYYYIDPDGPDTGEEPIEVYCNMSRTPPLAVIENVAACGQIYTNVGSWSAHSVAVDISYKESGALSVLPNIIAEAGE